MLLLAAAFAALVVDGVRSVAASKVVVTAFGETSYRLFPHSFPLLQPVVEQRLHPVLWDPFLLSFFPDAHVDRARLPGPAPVLAGAAAHGHRIDPTA